MCNAKLTYSDNTKIKNNSCNINIQFQIYQYQCWLETFSYQLLLQGCQGRLEPLFLGPNCVDDRRGCGNASDRLVSVHPQRPVHHLALFVPQQMQLLQPGQGSLQSLPDPTAVHAGGGCVHHPRTRAFPAQHGDAGRKGRDPKSLNERRLLLLLFFGGGITSRWLPLCCGLRCYCSLEFQLPV